MISDNENRVLEAVRQCGPLEAYRRLIAENNALIRGPDLKNGRAITTMRTAIHTVLAGQWAEEQQRMLSYDKPFALVALGGTGREEVTPCSDLDFAFLFDDALEGNALLLELQRQMLHTSRFQERHGFSCIALPFGVDDMPSLVGKQLNSFLDMRPVFDPSGLADRFRERIRVTFDPFEHFLHVRRFWKEQWEEAAAGSERLDCFDIKNDGLRIFLSGIWTLAGKTFIHSHDVYRTLEEPRDLEAYDFLLRIRAWIHLRRSRSGRPDAFGNRPADVLDFEDFVSFGEMLGPESDERMRFDFANGARSRLLSARRRVAVFARAVIERELRRGRAVAPGSPIIYGTGGLYSAASGQCRTERDKSRAARKRSATPWFPLRINAAVCKASAVFCTNHRAPNSALVPIRFFERRERTTRSKIELTIVEDDTQLRRYLDPFALPEERPGIEQCLGPSQPEFNGASRYRRGSGDSST